MQEPLTDKMLDELLNAPSVDEFIDGHEFTERSLSEYLQTLLKEKGLEEAQVTRMANIIPTYGYMIFKGQRRPSRNKVLQIALAMALNLTETNRALEAAGASLLYSKNRRDAIIIFCIDRGCSLQKTNEELYRFGEEIIG
ncbi:MAG: XRE family transcriptional regulator [Eggerthellaceae bacterium]|uniref:XRE family transcriptional regulator n=1 Tax=Denitrobacterium detoxificans TaxID=79604 RepID=A0A172RW49_9ACTN|nr:hypothetical protein [Denitrobacterium detoxificans]ANE21874.1 hypothetical protein AAY81_00290 [Denitrobacterium detoxificans]MBE6466857.1 XRE family transcriptional regulator [Denitrobacterium detoxificans]MCR5583005.1 XRE family transcriptional regulator [Eggerthellaceae bacterium]SEO43785.1 hypothetical protein SAMN02910314_00254 [Denitrobacterium detoxificans]